MTVKKATRCGGHAAIVTRQKMINSNSNQQFDLLAVTKSPSTYNIVVGFNEKDQLTLTKDENDEDKQKHKEYISKCENICIDDISNCVNVENYPNCENTLVFYVSKNIGREAIVVKFENEQDFKRIYFTYKYFKMRNRLTQNTTSNNHASSENLLSKKKSNDLFKNRKNSVDGYNLFKDRDFDLSNVDKDSLTHISVQNAYNSRYDQPMSLIGIRNDFADAGEIDSVIYTDVDIPNKPERRRLFHRKPKAPPPPILPLNKDNQSKILKGEFVRVNVDRAPDIIPKDNKLNKTSDILTFKDKPKRGFSSNLWSASNKVSGYESDREEWRSSRSQFSTTAFDSLARPTKMAMALTLRKPQRLEPIPQYYRLSSEPKTKLAPLPFRPNNFLQRPPRLPRPAEVNRSLNNDHRKYTSLQHLDIPLKLSEPKKQNDSKKNNYTTISNRITGLTNKLRDLGNPSNTIGRFKAQSHGDVANLKPVLKTGQDGSKRPVIRTCSAEPPKKVTFSAFATVQVV